MKRSFLLIVLASALTACDDKPVTPPATRVESAGEAMRNDNRAIAERLAAQKAAVEAAAQAARAIAERIQLAESIATISRRYSDALDDAGRTPRSDIGGAIKKLQSIKGEADALATNDCTDRARMKLLEAMATGIDAFTTFSRETGSASETARQKLQLAGTQLAAADSEISRCR